jgi:hypothetical protein
MSSIADASMAVAFFVSAASVAWTGAFAWSRWLDRRTPPPQLTDSDHAVRIEQRLESIEHAVQAIAVEVERLGEGQRFTTRILTERGSSDPQPPRLAPEFRRADTPH